MHEQRQSPGVFSDLPELKDLAVGSPSRGSEAPDPPQPARPSPAPTKTSILPVLLPPATLRPVAFRTFTRKHNLTISSSALQQLAAFVGKNCGSGWREEGLAEIVLDEVAKSWKKSGGGVIVEEGKGASLKTILQAIEGTMSGGRIAQGKAPSDDRPGSDGNPENGSSGHIQSRISATPDSEDQDEEGGSSLHIRNWIRIIDAFDHPRLTYNTDKKYFQTTSSKPTLLPPPSHKAAFLRDRYTLVQQRLLRNESFQASLASNGSSFGSEQRYRLAPISNLLGRSGTSHLVLGLLSISPAGDLSLVDLTGTVALDLSHARSIPEDGAWFTPGMVVLVDGIYEDEDNDLGSTLGGNSGVGGAIGGRFVAVSICGPPCERREISLGTSSKPNGDVSSSGGFGWVDFLGIGSERARGSRMRKVQTRCLQHAHSSDGASRPKIAIMGEVNLDNIKTLDALKSIFSLYNDSPLDERPLTFILIGNFVRNAIINASGQAGSVEYKEYFDSLALVMSEFPSLLRHSTFIFVPGDNDPWASAFSAGASSTIPRRGIPELFTSRVKRAFTTANSETETSHPGPAGEAIWTSNPSRLTFFGPVHDIAIFRDDVSGRLRRSAVSTKSDTQEPEPDGAMDTENISPDEHCTTATGDDQPIPTIEQPITKSTTANTAEPTPSALHHSRKLVKTILDQGTMSPFPLSQRPVLWDHASALQLYPLPTGFILADAEAAPFCITYEGCHVMNPGRVIPEGEAGSAKWVEYDVLRNRGRVREVRYQ